MSVSFSERADAQAVNATTGYAFIDTLTLLTPLPLVDRSLRGGDSVERSERESAGLIKPLRARSRLRQSRSDETPIRMGDWLLYENLTANAVYDDNVFQSAGHRIVAGGAQIRPRFIAERDAGIHHTTLYALGDFTIFPGVRLGDSLTARAGANHFWEPTRDLTIRASAEYAYFTSVFANTEQFGVQTSATQPYHQAVGSLSAIKSFDRLFVGLGGSFTETLFDPLLTTLSVTPQSFRDNGYYSTTGRLGYFVAPSVYSFIEGTGSFRTFSDSVSDSEGYRFVGGLGTGRFSLFKGEIFAGYQRRFYHGAVKVSPESPVAGANLYWYPTRAWTVSVKADETYQDTGIPTAGNPTGGAARAFNAQAQAVYSPTHLWSASAQIAYQALSLIDSGQHSRQASIGAHFAYIITRNVTASLDYQFSLIRSNTTQGNFERNQAGIGFDVKY